MYTIHVRQIILTNFSINTKTSWLKTQPIIFRDNTSIMWIVKFFHIDFLLFQNLTS